MGNGYGSLLGTRHVVRLLGGTLIGRLPHGMAALGILMFLRSEGAGYGLSGALAALWGVTVAVGQPLLGRAVDRRGQTWVMALGALLSAAGFVLLAAVGCTSLPLAAAGVALAGLAAPPLEGGMRALWPGLLRSEERVQAAYALDAAAQQILFASGPLLVTFLIAVGSEEAALIATGLIGVAGTMVVVTAGPSRRWRAAPRTAHWLGALRSSPLLVLLGSVLFVGVSLGAVSISAVAYGDEHGAGPVSAWILAANSLGALVGGLVYGSRTWPGTPEQRLRPLTAGLALCYLPLMLTPGLPWMIFLAALSGVFFAPVLACGFVVVDRVAPSGTVTEAFSWVVTALGVGVAAGTAVAGSAAQYGSSGASFAVAGGGGFAALAVLWVCGRFFVVTNHMPSPQNKHATPSPSDANAVSEV
ncbi:MFS transporter [Streptomyces sp. NPDC058773]|uniref:MFS transporter n=1 Tax=Streptomyces sp. NPDC058773 TaxID=3346632 RepID=UPI0036B0C388